MMASSPDNNSRAETRGEFESPMNCVRKIPVAKLKHPEELTVQQVGERFGVNPNVVYYWIEHGVIQARRLNSGTPYWITVSKTDEQKLRDWVRNSRKIR